MIRYFTIFLLPLLIPLSFASAFGAVDDFTTDQSLYHKDGQLSISGNVSFDPEIPFVTIQIFTPGKSNFADFNTVPVNSDGSFSAVFHVGGPTWTSDGIYPIKVTYDGNLEKSIEYKEYSAIPTEPESDPEPKPEKQPEPEQTISETKELGIASFVDETKDPQHYVDRYNNEIIYKEWFDDNYPQYSSIYEAVGLEAPVHLPSEIKIHAGDWATGKIDDSQFVTEIEFLLENNNIIIPNGSSQNISDDEIPNWIRNTALWWSQDLISEDEFVNSLKFLMQEEIIMVD